MTVSCLYNEVSFRKTLSLRDNGLIEYYERKVNLMGSFVQQIVHDNHKVFLDKLHSQYAKFLDRLPFFTYYYTLSRVTSRTDTGLQNVERLTGPNAPTKYNLIRDFPLFGMDQIQLDLQDEDDAGLDTSYSGEAIILPNCIQPNVDDVFWLTAVGRHFLFRVTEVAYDTIAHKNYYKINFEVREADDTTELDAIEANQINKKYQCIYDNYGTQEAWILEDTVNDEVKLIDELYQKVTTSYMDCFYNKKYNCLMVKDPYSPYYIFDIYVNHFCNVNHIFDHDLQNLYNWRMYEEFPPDFKFLYKGHSLQTAVVAKDLELIQSPRLMKYYDTMPTFTDSIFQYYGDFDTKGVKITLHEYNPFGKKLHMALPKEFYENLKSGKVECVNLLKDVIIQYVHDKMTSVGELLGNYSSKLRIRPTYEDYILAPMFLYCVYQYRETLTHPSNT